MSANARDRKLNRHSRRAIPAAGVLLVLAAVLGLWQLGGQVVRSAPLSAQEAAELPPSAAAEPAPSPAPTPPGTGVYAPSARPDGRVVVPKEDLCYWGMDLIDAGVRAHRCRFRSGSDQLLPDYDWGVAVPESEAVDVDYFSDAVFIGNSLAQGFMLYGGLKTADMFAMQSISVVNIGTEKVINGGEGEYITILDAMARKSYGKVFVMLGINELSWASQETFYSKYADLIDRIRKLEPEAELYLQSITPVTQSKSENSTTFNNTRIRDYNEVIRQLAEDKEAHYLYVFDAFADEQGCLPAGSSDDGIHPYSKYYPQWLTYLQTHTVTEVRK